MPFPYKINQPPHPGSGARYSVTVEGDAQHVPDGSSAVRTGGNTYMLPYKKAPEGNTVSVHQFELPYCCNPSQPLIEIQLTAKFGSVVLGGPKKTHVHDAT